MVLYLKWSEIGITLRKSQTPRGSVNKGRDVCEASRTGRGVNSQGQVSLPRMLFPALRLLPGAAPPPLLPFGVQELRLASPAAGRSPQQEITSLFSSSSVRRV